MSGSWLHITIDDEYRRPYVFMYGIGTMYPYLRANELLAKYEDYNETGRYKTFSFIPDIGNKVHSNSLIP